ncbi:hypothetical protein SAMN04489747_0920 [Auraticoccus monumenti]|uniref:Uncharacterized protein n=1 Tax=Auraticoccus monumenti TaxID=675864 RepID=A0A1G6UM74_9ACTN|nr:hypothetical protein SAMN04489747_0920 [Auraticoccus monumenti]
MTTRLPGLRPGGLIDSDRQAIEHLDWVPELPCEHDRCQTSRPATHRLTARCGCFALMCTPCTQRSLAAWSRLPLPIRVVCTECRTELVILTLPAIQVVPL